MKLKANQFITSMRASTFMVRFARAALLLTMLGLFVRTASAFSFIGPPESWQTAALTFQPLNGFDDLAAAPMNIGEEYRVNIPVLYYAFDANFLDYFGSNGVVAVENAISVINGLTNVSSYSRNLTEFPTAATRRNFTAETLFLRDLKSETMQILMEHFGVQDPVRYTWVLHGRTVVNPPCPNDMAYQIVQRNFDPVTGLPSSFVNGTLYSFFIIEECTPLQPEGILADAAEFPVDPLADSFSAVAGLHGDIWGLTANSSVLGVGGFYTGLTRDDVAGLRYLWTTNNINWESIGTNSTAFITNTTPAILTTSNLSLFAAQALTNDAATLQGLYPGLVITATSNYFGLVVTTNVTATFTNSPQAPVGSPALLIFTTNYVTNVVQFFQHTFANIITNHSANRGFVTVQTITVTNSPFGAAGTNSVPITNITSRTFLTNSIQGDFFVVPAGLCDVDIIQDLLATVVTTTNTIIVTSTNAPGVTNVNDQSFTQNIVTYFTNHTLVYRPVNCPSNVTTLLEGMEKIRFVRVNFDSLLGRFFEPFTNTYVLNSVTNSKVVPLTIQRVITAPDFTFSAQDGNGNAGDSITFFFSRTLNFNSANAGAGLAGPGTIDPIGTVIFNKAGPTYSSVSPTSFDPFGAEGGLTPLYPIWGAFDGSTNPPVAFPDGTSIQNLANQILLHPDQPSRVLPSGTNHEAYSFQLNGAGGQPPYTWSLAPASPGLPPGLNLSGNGLISGTPTMAGTFDFVIRLMDSTGRTVDWNYTVLIKPQ